MLADNKKRPRLFLSRVDKDYDPDCDFVLGPWCFLGREKIYPDWDKGTFLDAFDDPEEKKSLDNVRLLDDPIKDKNINLIIETS